MRADKLASGLQMAMDFHARTFKLGNALAELATDADILAASRAHHLDLALQEIDKNKVSTFTIDYIWRVSKPSDEVGWEKLADIVNGATAPSAMVGVKDKWQFPARKAIEAFKKMSACPEPLRHIIDAYCDPLEADDCNRESDKAPRLHDVEGASTTAEKVPTPSDVDDSGVNTPAERAFAMSVIRTAEPPSTDQGLSAPKACGNAMMASPPKQVVYHDSVPHSCQVPTKYIITATIADAKPYPGHIGNDVQLNQLGVFSNRKRFAIVSRAHQLQHPLTLRKIFGLRPPTVEIVQEMFAKIKHGRLQGGVLPLDMIWLEGLQCEGFKGIPVTVRAGRIQYAKNGTALIDTYCVGHAKDHTNDFKTCSFHNGQLCIRQLTPRDIEAGRKGPIYITEIDPKQLLPGWSLERCTDHLKYDWDPEERPTAYKTGHPHDGDEVQRGTKRKADEADDTAIGAVNKSRQKATSEADKARWVNLHFKLLQQFFEAGHCPPDFAFADLDAYLCEQEGRYDGVELDAQLQSMRQQWHDKNGIAQLPVNDHADNQNAFASASAYVTYPTTAEEGPDNVTQDKAVRGATQASDIGAPAKRYPARRKTIVS